MGAMTKGVKPRRVTDPLVILNSMELVIKLSNHSCNNQRARWIDKQLDRQKKKP